MTHGVTIQGHTAHAGGSTHLPIPAATHSGRDIHADLQRVHGRACPIVLHDPTPDAIAPETKRAQADVKRYAAPDIVGDEPRGRKPLSEDTKAKLRANLAKARAAKAAARAIREGA